LRSHARVHHLSRHCDLSCHATLLHLGFEIARTARLHSHRHAFVLTVKAVGIDVRLVDVWVYRPYGWEFDQKVITSDACAAGSDSDSITV
jgi:hypothetical protein